MIYTISTIGSAITLQTYTVMGEGAIYLYSYKRERHTRGQWDKAGTEDTRGGSLYWEEIVNRVEETVDRVCGILINDPRIRLCEYRKLSHIVSEKGEPLVCRGMV